NKIYIPNGIGNNQLAIIDGATEAVTTVPTGTNPEAVTLNPTTNKIYVANQFSNNISVVDGATNTVTATIPVGLFPTALAVNPVTNKIYVVNQSSGNVSIINGATNTVSKTVSTGSAPTDLAVNPVTSKIYVLNTDSTNNHLNSSVFVIDGTLDTVSAPISLMGRQVSGLTLNASRNKIYVSADESSALAGDAFLAAIDGLTNT